MTILEEIGTDVRHEGALALLAGAGPGHRRRARPLGPRVRDGDGRARTGVVHARGRATPSGRSGSAAAKPVLTPVGGSPFCADLERGRREGTISDYVELIKMAHAADLMTCQQSGTVEACDLDERTPPHGHGLRHPALVGQAAHLLRDVRPEGSRRRRPGGDRAAAGARRSRRRPAIMGVVNPNSPLVWDGLMADALMEWAVAGQPVIVTPFLLAGATAPVSIAAGLAQQVAEALSGVALVQAVRPGRSVPLRVVLHRRRHAHRRPRVRHARSRSSARSPAASSPAATGCRTAAAAACARRTPSTSRRRPRRPTRCGRR